MPSISTNAPLGKLATPRELDMAEQNIHPWFGLQVR